MVQLYNYQVWHTGMDASQACSSTSYISAVNQPLHSNVEVFLYKLINFLLTKNMYYENNLQKKS